jgi:hypothetical protein
MSIARCVRADHSINCAFVLLHAMIHRALGLPPHWFPVERAALKSTSNAYAGPT